MKTLLITLILVAYCSLINTVFAQENLNMIDVKRDFFSGWNSYSVKGKTLEFKDLKPIMEKYPDSKHYMELAKKRKNVGLPLAIVGLAGTSTAAILAIKSDNVGPIFWPSFGALIIGSGFVSSFFVNQQKAVNAYNQNLFRSVQSTAVLDIQISPLKSGIALRF